MKNYFKVEEGKEVNSIQEVYLTYNTIMINLIDTDSYDDMMIRVCLDIYENKNDIIEDIKKLPRKIRLFLGPIIYDWSKKEWKNHHRLPQIKARNGYTQIGNIQIQTSFTYENPFEDFIDNFEKAFHAEVLDEAIYRYEAKFMYLDYKFKNGKFNITMVDDPNYKWREIIGRMIVKYKEKENILNISYIENIKLQYSNVRAPQNFRAELFKAVRTIMNDIIKEKGEEPTIVCDKKYLKDFDNAKKRGYLVYKK